MNWLILITFKLMAALSGGLFAFSVTGFAIGEISGNDILIGMFFLPMAIFGMWSHGVVENAYKKWPFA